MAINCKDRYGIHACADWGCLRLWRHEPPCATREEIRDAAKGSKPIPRGILTDDSEPPKDPPVNQSGAVSA